MLTNSTTSKNHAAAPFTVSDCYRNILVLAILVSAGAAMVWMSWLKWPDLLVDFGDELYLTWQVSEGKVLYRDLSFVHGPFSIHLHALIFKLFGPGILTLALFNISLTAALSFLIYILIKRSSDQLTATICTLAFITLFAFGQYKGGGNFNFICAYLYELPHGVALSFLALYFFSKYIETKTLKRLAYVYISAGLVYLTKPEVFLAIITALASATALSFYLQSLDKAQWFRNSLVCIGSFLAGPFLFFIYFSLHVPMQQALTFVNSPWIHVFNSSNATLPFYQWVTGINSMGSNLAQLFKYFGLGVAVIFCVFLANRFIDKLPRPSKVISGSMGMLLAGLLYLVIQKFSLMDLPRPLPLITLLITIYYGVQIYQNRNSDAGKHVTQLAIAVFSLVLLLKIILNVHIFHYGFALALPATLVTMRWILFELPHLKNFFPGSTDFYRSAVVTFSLLLIASHIALGHKIHQLKTYPVGSGRDIIIEYSSELDPRGPIVAETLNYIQHNIEPGVGIATMPSGNMINYLTRHPNPLRIHSLNPIEAYIFGENQFLNEIKSVAPQYILLVDWDFTILGSRYFGQDYSQDIYLWIRKNYSIQKQFGAEPFAGKGFGIQILKRTG